MTIFKPSITKAELLAEAFEDLAVAVAFDKSMDERMAARTALADVLKDFLKPVMRLVDPVAQEQNAEAARKLANDGDAA